MRQKAVPKCYAKAPKSYQLRWLFGRGCFLYFCNKAACVVEHVLHGAYLAYAFQFDKSLTYDVHSINVQPSGVRAALRNWLMQ